MRIPKSIALDDITPDLSLSKIDARTDEWFGALLNNDLDRSSLSPSQAERAEAWRHFDVDGIVAHDFLSPPPTSLPASLSLPDIKSSLEASNLFLPDSDVEARLVYVDDVFVPSLSITSSSSVNIQNSSPSSLPASLSSYFATLPDGVTDDLPYKATTNRNIIPISKLSGTDHMVGPYNSQSCVNNQQGTACFAALNTVKCSNIALVEILAEAKVDKPIQVIRASSSPSLDTALHPRTIVLAGDGSESSLIQTNIDLSTVAPPSASGATLFNSYTQVMVGENATVTHSYVDESGGTFEGNVDIDDEAMERESQRPELQNTLLETISVHLNGQFASYNNAMIASGGSGRSKVALSAHLMEENTHVSIKGLCMSGGAQKMDMRTNIHHIASGCTSEQAQRNVVGGRSGTSFKGRIRVEQSAQQTDSNQLVRSLLLNERSRVWCMPSLEIIADDVSCMHGATVSDLSEEELFYLRARGLDRETSRNLQLYAFLDDVSRDVHPAYLGDDKKGLKARLGEKLQNIIPRGDRAVKGEFSSV
ncbi:hypothetical protein TrRE_jg6919 [Triparma retinervis]|uniref:SUF system FeS cluster assembly SufBD core domain-containing protein n=1 Tax=Triparma retinervis TaxID=2557542 RepID=A0A9W7G2Z2_9STRA|nr:hypothetical protein TrRE_jg6919 [Triparma retinervis]